MPLHEKRGRFDPRISEETVRISCFLPFSANQRCFNHFDHRVPLRKHQPKTLPTSSG